MNPFKVAKLKFFILIAGSHSVFIWLTKFVEGTFWTNNKI